MEPGVIIDTPVSLLRYKALHPGYSPSLIEISKTKAGGFDISSDHVRFFFLCNLSGALSTMCIIHYASTLEGFSEFMNSGNLNTIAVLIMILGVFISLYNNYSLQTDPDDIRNGHNYLLSRVHAFTNTIYLSFSTGISAFIMFCMIYYSIKTYDTEMTRFNSAFCAMTLSAYAFLWFTADSPLATDLNSISNKNFLAGTPFLMAFTMIYTAVFFEPVTACFFTIATTVVVGIVWVLYVIHRKSTKFIKPSRSFFAIFTVLVLIMMLFKVFS